MSFSKSKSEAGVKEIAIDDGNPDVGTGEVVENADHLLRRLDNRQIQLMAVGGSIGTGLFVSIGTGLYKGGPGNLFLAYTLYSCFMALINNSMAEMSVYMPVSGSFIRMAGKWVDEAFGFAAGWNFFFYEALLIPFEITALNLVLKFWRDDIPVAAVCAACVVLYGALNILAVKYYGEAEFWLASGKLILILILFAFTFVSMVGGNPQHDAYGFRYWNNPGAFAEYVTTGSLGRFEGFLGALWSAAFTICGPEYVSMISAEAKRPRIFMKTAYKTLYWRFGVFFIGSALAVGIILAHNDPKLVAVVTGTSSTAGAGASPYVIAMQNFGVHGLPHLVNALLVTSIFSAGNSYTYCATRSLYSLSLNGHAPKIFSKATKSGVPWVAFLLVMVFPFLSFLQVSNSSSQVLTWLVDLVTAGQVIDYIVISITYIFWFNACKAQGFDRKTLPYRGWFQPYGAYIGAAFATFVVFTYGYTTFLPGNWSLSSFFSYYTMLGVFPVLYVFWKLLKRTKFVGAKDADLIWESKLIDQYEASFLEAPVGFWTELVQMCGVRKRKTTSVEAY